MDPIICTNLTFSTGVTCIMWYGWYIIYGLIDARIARRISVLTYAVYSQVSVRILLTSECKSLWGEPEQVHRISAVDIDSADGEQKGLRTRNLVKYIARGYAIVSLICSLQQRLQDTNSTTMIGSKQMDNQNITVSER